MAKTALVVHLLNTLIGCLSIAILGLVSHSVALKDGIGNSIPENLKGTGMSLLFWPGVGGIVDVLLILLVWTIAQRHDSSVKRNAKYLNWLLFFSGFIFVRTLVVLIYVFVELDGSIKDVTNPTSGYVSVEAWACGLSTASEVSGASALCAELKAARYLLIPVLIFSAILWSFLLKERIGRRGSEKETQCVS